MYHHFHFVSHNAAYPHKLSHEVDRLQSIIKAFEDEQVTLKEQLSAATAALVERSTECQSWQDRLDAMSLNYDESKAACKEIQRKLRETVHEMELLKGEKASVEEMLRESSSKYNELLQQCSGMATMDFDSSYVKQRESLMTEGAHTTPRHSDTRPLVVATATAIELVDSSGQEDGQEEHFLGSMHPLNNDKLRLPEFRLSSRSTESEQANSSTDSIRAAKDDPSKKPQHQRDLANNGKMLLHQQVVVLVSMISSTYSIGQADSNLKDSVAVLRRENSSLTIELIELKNDVSLREEQVTFNSQPRHLNFNDCNAYRSIH